MTIDKQQIGYVTLRNMIGERTRQFVAWTGSGASAPAEMPTWPQLRRDLVSALETKARNVGDPKEQQRLENEALVAAKQQDLWIAFQILSAALQKTSYTNAIKNAFKKSENCAPPEIYDTLWKLRFSGVLNFNLDRLASRSAAAIHQSRKIHEFSGAQAGSLAHILQQSNPFIVNLHGIIEDASSWVFTPDERNRLLGNAGYLHFLKTCLTTRTVLFLGISADDVSITNHFDALRDSGIDFGSHFWITDRTGTALDAKAEALGIQIIRYQNVSGRHAEVLEFLKDLGSFVPKEPEAPVVQPPQVSTRGVIDSPRDLTKKDSEEIRLQLNSQAAEILGSSDSDAYRKFSEFTTKYAAAIYRAWYVTTREPDNVFLEYVIDDKIGQGAFGTVYSATAPDSGDRVAIKVLHHELLQSEEMLQSFRRGVRAMRLLVDVHTGGIVRFLEASELPAFVVMELIDGADLKQAVEAGHIEDWHQILSISRQLTHIIKLAHEHPQRVLHRDIRPSNIMLRDFYSNPATPNVVVLDFDLSWHRDATEMSIQKPTSLSGYLAPEQINKLKHSSTRSGYVDSFGIGMTMFFLATGRDPQVGEADRAAWPKTLLAAMPKIPSPWQSLPNRFARLIESCTKTDQRLRLDIGQIQGELQMLVEALQDPMRVNSAELIAEEVMRRATSDREYRWSDEMECARVQLASGAEIHLAGDEVNSEISLSIKWDSSGERDHKEVGKWIAGAATKIRACLKKCHWAEVSARVSPASLHLSFTISSQLARQTLDTVSNSVAVSIESLVFS